MAISSSTILEVRSGGSDTNGGGFVTGASGTDWSQQTSAQYAVTDGVTNGTTTITSASAAFGTDVVGNLVYVQGGTGAVAAGWYQIISRTSATAIVVDRATGLTAGTGVTLHIGGALASPGQAGAIGVNTFVKYSATPFAITSATANVAGGCVTLTSFVWMCGYDVTRSLGNLDANRPTLQLQSGVTGATIITSGTTGAPLKNLILDGNGQTGSAGFTGRNQVYFCKFQNFLGSACAPSTGPQPVIGCEATGNAGTSFGSNCAPFACVAHGNTATPFAGPTEACIAYGNTGATTSGFAGNANGGTSYGNGQHGFNLGSNNFALVNCVAEANGGNGFAGVSNSVLINCGSFNNTSGRLASAALADITPITGTASFFVNAAGGNFATNTTAGAGALLRAAGYPATFPAGLTASAHDVGASQHADPVLPTVAQVLSGVTFGFGSSLTGTVTLPTVNQVTSGTTFGPSGGSTGTVTLPIVADVLSGITYGAGGTQFTGTLTNSTDYPIVSNVLYGVTYDFGALVGTFGAPVAGTSVLDNILNALVSDQQLAGITIGGNALTIVKRKLPKKEETVDAAYQVTVSAAPIAEEVTLIGAGRSYLVKYNAEVTLITPNDHDALTNLTDLESWRERTRARYMSGTTLSVVTNVKRVEIGRAPFLDRGLLAQGFDYQQIALSIWTYETR